MEIRANFTALGDLEGGVYRTVGGIGDEMGTWKQAAGLAQIDWEDLAGSEFEGVSSAWLQLIDLQTTLLNEMGLGVGNASKEMEGALFEARRLIGGTSPIG
jgi:hypothetical protein